MGVLLSLTATTLINIGVDQWVAEKRATTAAITPPVVLVQGKQGEYGE